MLVLVHFHWCYRIVAIMSWIMDDCPGNNDSTCTKSHLLNDDNNNKKNNHYKSLQDENR